ncbi:MAG TPA: hypothetical protein DCE55_29385 [Planctomycetaceae bacterium]|nr:hypothetical protein [Planctomycetaceae bacterium]|tara:strand:- start:3702 stop:4526 length:825 start_codon:yes stop_codon:yes gene_type:complete
MAEFAIKIGDQGDGSREDLYKDGDVLAAFSDERICCVHAEMICDVRKFGMNSAGLRPDSLAKTYLSKTAKYMFERVSKTEVRRTTLATGDKVLFDDVPKMVDGKMQHMFVEEFLRRRVKSDKHLIFGKTLLEAVWFGGGSTPDNIAEVWDEIENLTAKRRDDPECKIWPAGQQDLKSHLFVETVNFTSEEANNVTSPQNQIINEGQEDERTEMVRKRVIKAQWDLDEVLDHIKETKTAIRDRNKTIDHRGEAPIANRELLFNKALGQVLVNPKG